MESYYYLKPGFDSKKLTISQLTSILSFHNVKLPGTSQRKYVYLDLFDREIKAHATKILNDLNAVEASDDGVQFQYTPVFESIKHSTTRDSSPVRKRVKQTIEITPTKIHPIDTQSIKPPTLDRFLISPSLPGIRSSIKVF